MKKKQRLRLFIVRLTAIMFAAYSAFYIFVLIRDLKQASLQELLIEALVSLLFALLSAFAWTSEVSNLKFIRVRRIVFIIALLGVVLLKLRLTGSVIAFLDFTGEYAFLFALYGAAFFMSLMALIILLVYYTFIRRNMPLYPKLSVILPISAMILFILSFAAEILLFAIYRFGVEDSMLRTLFSRPVFYLGFIGLSAYFLYPPRVEETAGYKPPDDSEFVKPADRAKYTSPEGSKRAMPDSSGFVTFEKAKHKHHKGKKHVNIDDSDFVIFDDTQHKPHKGTKHINVDDSDFVRPDNTEYIPPGGAERKMPDNSDFIMPGEDTHN